MSYGPTAHSWLGRGGVCILADLYVYRWHVARESQSPADAPLAVAAVRAVEFCTLRVPLGAFFVRVCWIHPLGDVAEEGQGQLTN